MRSTIGRLSVATWIATSVLLLAAACDVPGVIPDPPPSSSGSGGGLTESSTGDASTGDETGTGCGSEPADETTSGEPDETSGDGSSSEGGDGSTTYNPNTDEEWTCGDGVVDPGEECDGGEHCGEFCHHLRYAFISSTLHVGGELGGADVADSICAARAAEAALPGTYRAWIAEGVLGPADRLTSPPASMRWRSTCDGHELGLEEELAPGVGDGPPAMGGRVECDEHGAAPPLAWTPDKPWWNQAVLPAAWHGSDQNGQAAYGEDCGGWSDVTATGGAGLPSSPNFNWAGPTSLPCDLALSLVCVGVGQ